MIPAVRLPGQAFARRQGPGRGFRTPPPASVRVIEHSAYPLANATACLRLCRPHLGDGCDDVAGGDVPDRLLAERGKGIGFEGSKPLASVLAACPLVLAGLVQRQRGFAEGDSSRLRLALLGEQIAPVLANRLACLSRLRPRAREGHELCTAQAYIASFTLVLDA